MCEQMLLNGFGKKRRLSLEFDVHPATNLHGLTTNEAS